MLLENGKYKAKLSGQIIVYEAESGSLCLAVPCRVCEGPQAGTDIKHTVTLVNKERELREGNCETMRTVFGWDGADPFWLSDTDLSAAEFEIVVENEDVTDNFGTVKTVSKVKWVNALGGGT